MGFGVWGFGVWGLGFGVWGLGFGVWGRVWGSGPRASTLGAWFRVLIAGIPPQRSNTHTPKP